MPDLRSTVLRIAADLPVGDPTRRSLLTILADEGEDEKTAPSGGGPSKMMLKFLEDHGDDMEMNPDTGRKVKVKTLGGKPKDSGARKKFDRLLDKWKEQEDKKDEGGKKEQKKDEEKEKDEGKGKEEKSDRSKQGISFKGGLAKGTATDLDSLLKATKASDEVKAVAAKLKKGDSITRAEWGSLRDTLNGGNYNDWGKKLNKYMVGLIDHAYESVHEGKKWSPPKRPEHPSEAQQRQDQARRQEQQSRQQQQAKIKKEHDDLKAEMQKKLKSTRFKNVDPSQLEFVMISTPSSYRPNVPGVSYKGERYYADEISPKDIAKLRELKKKLPKDQGGRRW